MRLTWDRRNLLIGTACLAGAGVAEGLKPRRQLLLLKKGASFSEVIPRTLPNWESRDVTNLVAPRETDSLASRLYNQTVGRVYTHAGTGESVMLLGAYGETQSRDLQLHRPENCYPAFGFSIRQSTEQAISLGNGVSLPARRVLAEMGERHEAIVYWTRLGNFVPRNGSEQRMDVLKIALSGHFADGVLLRLSAVGLDPDANFKLLDRFALDLIKGSPAAQLPVLVGQPIAQALVNARGTSA